MPATPWGIFCFPFGRAWEGVTPSQKVLKKNLRGPAAAPLLPPPEAGPETSHGASLKDFPIISKKYVISKYYSSFPAHSLDTAPWDCYSFGTLL